MIERNNENYGTDYRLVFEAELKGILFDLSYSEFPIEIVNSGEKLQNAYIYALCSEHFDLDKELYETHRLSKPFDIFSPMFIFEHSSQLKHQN